jgi:hypothetical protein
MSIIDDLERQRRQGFQTFGGGSTFGGYPGAGQGPPVGGFNPMVTRPPSVPQVAMGFGSQPQMGFALQQLLTGPDGGGGMGPETFQPSGGSRGQGLGDRIAGGIGKVVGGVGDWLTDPEQGLSRTYLASQLLGAAGNIYGARQENKRYEKEQERADREREEQKANYESWDPMRQEIMARYLGRM